MGVRWLIALTVFLAAPILSCDDDRGGAQANDGVPDDGGSNNSGDTVTQDYLDVVDEVCGFLDRCGDAVPTTIAYRTRAECRDILVFAFTCRVTSTGGGDLEIGRRVPSFTAAQAAACEAWLREVTCEGFSVAADKDQTPEGTPCDGLLYAPDDEGDSDGDDGGGAEPEPPLPGLGELCPQGRCDAESQCTRSGEMIDGQLQCAVCTELPGEGEPCATSSFCRAGYYCQVETDEVGNQTRTCVAQKATGAPCDRTPGGWPEECLSDFCDLDRDVCSEGGLEGDPCQTDFGCRFLHICTGGRCEPMRERGEPCERDTQCANYDCHSETRRCGASLGERCSTWPDCAEGICNPSEGVCAVARGLGERCDSNGECETGACRGVCFEPCADDTSCEAGQLCNRETRQCEELRAEGSACEDDEQCRSGWCRDDVCAMRSQIGESCQYSTDCPAHGYCNAGSCEERKAPGAACEVIDSCMSPFLCLKGTCTLIDLSCEPGRVGKPCALLQVCEANAFCDYAADFTCAARKGLGESCAQPAECARGTFCDYTSPNPVDGSFVCAAGRGEGESCRGFEACAEGLNCVEILGEDEVCRPEPWGQRCDGDSEDDDCPSGFYCDDDDLCLPIVTMGQACRDERACGEGLHCAQGICSGPSGPGGPCDSGNPACDEGLYCENGTCAHKASRGEPCLRTAYENRCQPGLFCLYDAQNEGTCEPQLGTGEACVTPFDCVSGFCDQTLGCIPTDACVEP